MKKTDKSKITPETFDPTLPARTPEAPYRPINIHVLNKNFAGGFDIFYKTKSLGKTRYLKFAGDNPEHLEKVRKLLESGDLEQELFIREENRFKYFTHATEALREYVSDPDIPVQEKTKKIYDISTDIMKEFFEYNATHNVLRVAEDVMGLMDDCLHQDDLGFYMISQILHKDYYTYTHSVNVGLYCMTYGLKVNMGPDDARELGLGGMLHDVGKAYVPNEIINKNGVLNTAEFEEIKKHPKYGETILSGMNCFGNNIIYMAGQHHEKFNGNGYPRGLSGEDISLFSRICMIMDVYDALTTRRSYKKPLSPERALHLMKQGMAEFFDNKILERFIRLLGPGS